MELEASIATTLGDFCHRHIQEEQRLYISMVIYLRYLTKGVRQPTTPRGASFILTSRLSTYENRPGKNNILWMLRLRHMPTYFSAGLFLTPTRPDGASDLCEVGIKSGLARSKKGSVNRTLFGMQSQVLPNGATPRATPSHSHSHAQHFDKLTCILRNQNSHIIHYLLIVRHTFTSSFLSPAHPHA